MHERYIDKEMSQIWSEENKFEKWFEVELNVCKIQGDLGIIPQDVSKTMETLKESCLSSDYVKKINDIEKTTKHDIIAFLTHLSNVIGEPSKYIHFGMTSQDLIDTSQAILIRESISLIKRRLLSICNKLKEKSIEHKFTYCIGRTHGIHAEPMTFGLKMLSHYASFQRCFESLIRDVDEMVRIKCSGAVGNYGMINPSVEENLSARLRIPAEDISTQVVPRERLALLFSHLSIIAGCIERFAIEIRHLQRTEVGEVIESFTKGQKGSSAMPHKKNPILSENLTGLARLVRMSLIPAMENIALWHERDISHSSVERVILPDTFTHLSFALKRMESILDNMVVNVDKMKENIALTKGSFYSQKVLLYLIKEKNYTREHAYELVQEVVQEGKSLSKGIIFYGLVERGIVTEDELFVLVGLSETVSEVNEFNKNIEYLSLIHI